MTTVELGSSTVEVDHTGRLLRRKTAVCGHSLVGQKEEVAFFCPVLCGFANLRAGPLPQNPVNLIGFSVREREV